MTFEELLDRVLEMLQRRGRVSYPALKRQFDLDDAYLEDLKEEILFSHPQAVDEAGRGLVWTGESQTTSRRTKPRAPDAERRQLTVMFCDLVDSTALSRQLDPEDLREVVRAYQTAAAEVIQRFEGHIAQLLGDGLLVYFGYPQAHEDDARRAVRAGLEIVEAMAPLNIRLKPQYGIRLAIRVGIHTGLVVIGPMGGGERHEQLAMGDTPNVAARLQGLAPSNTVVLSAATSRLVQGVFGLADLGVQHLKGVAEPMAVFRLLGSGEPASDEAEPIPARMPFLVGRDEEIGLLLRRWEQSKEGLGQVVLLSGEAGIGKTALVEVLRAHVGREGYTRVGFRGSPYHTHSALYPVIEHVRRVLHLDRYDSPETTLDKLERALQGLRLLREEVIPLLAALLSVPLPEGRYPALTLTPQQQRQQTLDALVAWLVAEAERRPVLAVYEDVHWADPSTLEFLSMLVEQAPTAPMLHVLTFRPDFVPPWHTRSHITPITLNRLERPQVEALIRHLAGGKALPATVVQHIVTRTDGVPLFVEELTKMVLESGLLREEGDHYVLVGPLSSVPIPATLHDSLMARLDRLPMAKDVAQLGAVLGREFSYALLQALTPLNEATLQARLGQLVTAELLYQRGRPPRATYMFKHALIQDTAYQSLLRSTRQQYHQQIARVLETQFAETVETQPELLAHHYTEAGLSAPAVAYWQRAGQRAIQRSANLEAIGHLTKGLEVLRTLPDTPDRAQQELLVQTTLGPALIATQGYAAPDVEQTYARARALCEQIGETPQLFPVLWGLRQFYHVRGALHTAHALGEQLVTLARSTQDASRLLEAHLALGHTLFFMGKFALTLAHLEQSMALYDPQQHRMHVLLYGQDPRVFCLFYMAVTLWHLGYVDRAIQKQHEALTLAQDLAHPFSQAVGLFFAAIFYQFCREVVATRKYAELAIALCRERGFSQYGAMGAILRGWALTEQDQSEEGIAQMRQGLTAMRATGAELARPHFLVLLADAYHTANQPEAGLAVLAELLAAGPHREARHYEAALYRLKGDLLVQSRVRGLKCERSHPVLRTPHLLETEACFQQALAIARRQQAKSWELRAAMSLSRLWQQQGKFKEAHDLLAPIYGWFTEGFDTADLQEAKALLEELGT